MKRTPIQRKTPLRSRTKLNLVGHSDAAQVKQNIQDLLREIVIIRDGGCILRNVNQYDFLDGGKIGIPRELRIAGIPLCNGYAKDGHLILQADHLITRANAATYADSRLVVCLCKGHHGWKSKGDDSRKKLYDQVVRSLLPPDRVALWDACEADKWRPTRKYGMDWRVVEAALRVELTGVRSSHEDHKNCAGD